MIKKSWIEISIGVLEFLYPKTEFHGLDFEANSRGYELRKSFDLVLEHLKKELES